MIYAISLSPAIDYVLNFENLKKGKTNRPENTDIYPAGKGVHVSMMLNNLDIENESIIFSNGYLEQFYYNALDKIGVKYKKFNTLGDIRINLKLIDGEQTECSVASPIIENSEIDKLKEYLKTNISKGDFLVLAGSLPKQISYKIYGDLVEIANKLNAKCIVDSFGSSLEYAITKKPFLIKPNVEELQETSKIIIKNDQDIIRVANTFVKKGVENILVSNGANGAILINKDFNLKCSIGNWNKKLINAAGSGDSMIAGFLSEYIKTNRFEDSLKKAIICGSATAYSNRIANEELIDELSLNVNQLIVTKI